MFRCFLTLFFKEDGYLLSQPLLVIDMLHDFLDEKGSLYIGDAADQVKKNVKERLFKQRSKANQSSMLWTGIFRGC